MRSREEIKDYAKQTFKAQRGPCVLGLFLVMLLTSGYSIVTNIPNLMINFSFLTQDYNFAYLGVLTAITSIIGLLAIPVMLISFVLSVNISGFFVKVYYSQPVRSTEPYYEIRNNFSRKLGGMCWEFLWTYLWTMAFIAPVVFIIIFTIAIAALSYTFHATENFFFLAFFFILAAYIPVMIKVLSYSMTKYILASNPNVKATDAIKLSMRMTKGHKGKIFLMWMSFVGWQLLNILTLGLLGIFYVNPYMYASFAGQFVELRSHAVATGVIHPMELDGIPQQHIEYYQHQYQQYPNAQQYAPNYNYPQQTVPDMAKQYTQHLQQPPQTTHYVPEPLQQSIHQQPQYIPEPQQPPIPEAPPIPEPPPNASDPPDNNE